MSGLPIGDILDKEGWAVPGLDGEVRKSPPWKEAVVKFLALDPQPKQIIRHEWFYEAFGIIEPEKCGSIGDAMTARLRYAGEIEAMRNNLLEEHNIALRNVRGVGYEIVPPTEQTDWAMSEVRTELRKAMRNGAARLAHIRIEELTDDQKKANLDAQGRLAAIRSMSRKELAQ